LALRLRLGPRADPRDTASNLIEKAVKDQLIRDNYPGDLNLALTVRLMRNEWARGSVHIHTHAMTLGVLEFCTGIINELFEFS
jgi:hypothetical protein